MDYFQVHRLIGWHAVYSARGVICISDAAGNRTRLVRPDNYALTYEYDALNRLTGITDQMFSRTYTFGYDAAGRPVSRVYPNGVSSAYAYDAAGRLASLEHRKDDGALLARFAYTYDAGGNRLTATDSLGERLYSYDRLNRLTKAVYGSGRTQEFAYDPVGSRTSLTEEWPEILAKINKVEGTPADGKVIRTVDYTYDAADRLLSAGNKTYTHDVAGRLTRISDNTGSTVFDYDMFDRPWRITYPASVNPQMSVYQYAPMTPDLRFAPSPLGMRTGKRDAQGYHRHLLDDDGNLLAELDISNITRKRYIHAGLDAPLSLLDEYNQPYYYLPDGQGSTAMLTDKHGDPAQVYDYEAYGKPNITAADKNRIKYTGREYDTDAKLQYNRARYYDPDLGRWITPDPLAYAVNTAYYSQAALTAPMGLNKCIYGQCNPTTYTDPLGLVIVGFTGWGASPTNLQSGVVQIAQELAFRIGEGSPFAYNDDRGVQFINHQMALNSKQPIIIFGHSYGGTAAIEATNRLCGFKTSLLITIDPIKHYPKHEDVAPVNIKNVTKAINYYQRTDTRSAIRGLRGYTLTGMGDIQNIDIATLDINLGEMAHIEIDNSPQIQKDIIDEIIRVRNGSGGR